MIIDLVYVFLTPSGKRYFIDDIEVPFSLIEGKYIERMIFVWEPINDN